MPREAAEQLSVSITADGDHLSEMRRQACDFCARHGVRRLDDVALAVGEACANVVRHAYAEQPPGPLHLTGLVQDELVVLRIADEGRGLVPRLGGHGLGLGLPIIARACDHFALTDRQPAGTVVSLVFSITDPSQAASPHLTETEVLEQVREEILAAVRQGASLDAVQPHIDGAPVSDDVRAALWLWAWATVDRGHAHRSLHEGRAR